MTESTCLSRILIVTRNLPPLVGGMERLNWHMAEELAKIAEVRIVGPQGSAALSPAGIAVREAPLRPLWKFLRRARSLARREARHWKPDIVLAGSGLTAPIAQSAAHTCCAHTAVYVHGLDVAVRHLAYRVLWLPAIRRMDRVIANSRATAALCRHIGVEASRIGIVHPGVDLPADPEQQPDHRGTMAEGENADAAANFDLRTRHGLGARSMLLSVGRLSARKGLREFVAQALPRVVEARPDAMLLIVGDVPSQALHAEAQTPASIQVVADAAGVGQHVLFLGKVSDDELAAIYKAAGVHVFPVRDTPGDPEGFGMVAVEAAAHGLPTVAFATGGVVDAVADGQSGYLVPSGDYTAFADAVLKVFASYGAMHPDCISFARGFAWPVFGERLVGQLSGSAKKSMPVNTAP